MATISEVTIAHMALSLVGASGLIESFEEDSVEADQTKLWYDFSRQQALEAADWNFARKRAALALHAETADQLEWGWRYVYPVDALRCRYIANPLGKNKPPVPFEVETGEDGEKSILANVPGAVMVYTFDQTRVTTYSPLFVMMLASALASNIAFVVTGQQTKADAMVQKFNQLRPVAMSANGNERALPPPQDADWITGR